MFVCHGMTIAAVKPNFHKLDLEVINSKNFKVFFVMKSVECKDDLVAEFLKFLGKI